MLKITKKNFKTYLLGSKFFATGGGLPFLVSQKIFENIFQKKKSVTIQDLGRIKDGFLVSIYGVGDPSKADPKKDSALAKRALVEFKKIVKKNIVGLIPGEIGAEASAFLVASTLNLGVVNSDLVGGRAAPEIQMDVFSVFGLQITPVMGFAGNGKSILITENISAAEVEKRMRPFFAKNGGSGIIIGYLIEKKNYQKYGMKNTLTAAFEVGKILQEGNLARIKTKLLPKKVIIEKIKKVYLKSKKGFLVGKILFENCEIIVKNENIILKAGNRILAQVPECIIILDNNLRPIHNSLIARLVSNEVYIVILGAKGYWKTKKGKSLWMSALK